MPFTVSHAAAALPFFRFTRQISRSGLGLLMWLIWHHWMRAASRDLCPVPLREAEFDYSPDSGPRPITVYVSLCTGAATHAFWDGFTH